ncbi:MAG: hypothetical protein V7742_14025 [Halioglobus sp.]
MNMEDTKALEDFQASYNIMRGNIDLFYGGNRETYRVVATELRKLLFEGERSLLYRVFRPLRMHPIRNPYGDDEFAEHVVLQMPFRISHEGAGGVKVSHMFDRQGQPMELEAWGNQALLNAKITLRGLVRSVSDKQGAHADPQYNDALLFSRSVKVYGVDLHKPVIVAIGEYILEFMEIMRDRYPGLRD